MPLAAAAPPHDDDENENNREESDADTEKFERELRDKEEGKYNYQDMWSWFNSNVVLVVGGDVRIFTNAWYWPQYIFVLCCRQIKLEI